MKKTFFALLLIIFQFSSSLANPPTEPDLERSLFADIPTGTQIILDLGSSSALQHPVHATREVITPGVRSDISVLILPGLFESPFFMSAWEDYFVRSGFNVVNQALDGHFTNKRGILKVRHEDWLANLENGMRKALKYGKKVIIVGHSTGGALAYRMALDQPEKVAGLILLAPALTLTNRVFLSSYFLGWSRLAAQHICNPEKRKGPGW